MTKTHSRLLTHTVDARAVLQLPSHQRASFPLRLVVGLELPAMPPLLPADADRDRLQSETITLSDDKTWRLAEFILRVSVNQENLFHNCLTFTSFMHGDSELDDAHEDFGLETDGLQFHAVDPQTLQSGAAYVVFKDDLSTAVHGLIGTNTPHEHMGVWGDSSYLAISHNKHMLETYRGKYVLRVDGRLALRSGSKI